MSCLPILGMSLLFLLALWLISLELGAVLACVVFTPVFIVLPGFLAQSYLLRGSLTRTTTRIATSVIVGFSLTLTSFFLWWFSGLTSMFWLPLGAYLLLMRSEVRGDLLTTVNTIRSWFREQMRSHLLSIWLITLISILYPLMLNPMPGAYGARVLQDFHPLSHVFYLISLRKGFPIQLEPCLNIITSFGYSSFVNIFGFQATEITALSPLLFFTRYYYLTIMPLTSASFLLLLHRFGLRGSYLVFGFALLMFGEEFYSYQSPFWVRYYTPVPLGMILFLNVLTVFVDRPYVQQLRGVAVIGIGCFLLAGARIHGALVFSGLAISYLGWVWLYFRENMRSILPAVLSVSLFSALSFYFFWMFGVDNSHIFLNKNDYHLFWHTRYTVLGHYVSWIGSSPFVTALGPVAAFCLLSVVASSAWVAAMVYGWWFTLPVVPSLCRRFRIGFLGSNEIILLTGVAVTYVASAFLMLVAYEENYLLMHAQKLLLVVFVIEIQRACLFTNLRVYISNIFYQIRCGGFLTLNLLDFRNCQYFLQFGLATFWLVILISPFWTVLPIFDASKAKEMIKTIFLSSRVYQPGVMKAWPLGPGTIDPSMYQALMFIRQNTTNNAIVVAPYFVVNPRYNYFISAFTERVPYLGTGPFTPETSEVQRRRSVLNFMVREGRIPSELTTSNYVFLLRNSTLEKLRSNHEMDILYANPGWTVARVDPIK